MHAIYACLVGLNILSASAKLWVKPLTTESEIVVDIVDDIVDAIVSDIVFDIVAGASTAAAMVLLPS